MAAEQDYPEAPPTERDAEAEELVAKVLDYLLSSMGVVAETYVRDETENGSLVFEIEGADAGLLIGRRGETLAAVQFMVRMIANRQLGRKCYVIIDVEGYRERRSEMLRQLARRTAGRVANYGRPAALEPMSPAERRIIHMALADHPRVHTESEGEGSRRRVVVLPKRPDGTPQPPRAEPAEAEERTEPAARTDRPERSGGGRRPPFRRRRRDWGGPRPEGQAGAGVEPGGSAGAESGGQAAPGEAMDRPAPDSDEGGRGPDAPERANDRDTPEEPAR